MYAPPVSFGYGAQIWRRRGFKTCPLKANVIAEAPYRSGRHCLETSTTMVRGTSLSIKLLNRRLHNSGIIRQTWVIINVVSEFLDGSGKNNIF